MNEDETYITPNLTHEEFCYLTHLLIERLQDSSMIAEGILLKLENNQEDIDWLKRKRGI